MMVVPISASDENLFIFNCNFGPSVQGTENYSMSSHLNIYITSKSAANTSKTARTKNLELSNENHIDPSTLIKTLVEVDLLASIYEFCFLFYFLSHEVPGHRLRRLSQPNIKHNQRSKSSLQFFS